jgi:uncharacterized membrane protein
VDALSRLGNTRMLRSAESPHVAMTEPAAVRRVTVALSVAYPVLAHFAIARDSAGLTITALTLLALVTLLPSLARGAAGAWFALLLVAGACWWLSTVEQTIVLLYLPPIIVPAFLACVFANTLLSGRTPLIAQLIRLLQAPGDEPESAVWSYARRLTAAWTVLFVALVVFNLALAALAQPHVWSLFTNLLEYLIVAAFFAIEYAYRRQRFPRQPYRNMFDFVRRLLAAMPRLMRSQ